MNRHKCVLYRRVGQMSIPTRRSCTTSYVYITYPCTASRSKRKFDGTALHPLTCPRRTQVHHLHQNDRFQYVQFLCLSDGRSNMLSITQVDADMSVRDFAAFCKACCRKKAKIGLHFAAAKKGKCAGSTTYEEYGLDGKRNGVIRDWVGPFPVSA